MNLTVTALLAAIVIVVKVNSSDYEIILEKIESALGDKDRFVKFDTLRVKKFNKTTYVFNGKYTLLTQIDDSHTAKADLMNMQGGQYRKMFEFSIDEMCKNIYNDTYRDFFDKFQAAHTKPIAWKTCPYPSGPNEMNNFYLEDFGNLLPAYLPGSEKWKIQMRFFQNETGELGGYDIYVILRNQRSLLEG